MAEREDVKKLLEGVTEGPWEAVIPEDELVRVLDRDATELCFLTDGDNDEQIARFIAASRTLLPALAEENERLRGALTNITSLTAGGPHLSAKDGLRKALNALDHARFIARAALTQEKR